MPLPRQLHQIWWQGIDAIPSKYESYRAAVKKHLPKTWSHHVWNGDEIIALARGRFPECAVILEQKDIPIIQKCDLGRMLLLQAFGGIYLDMDVMVFDSIEKLKLVADVRMTERGFCIVQEAIFTNNWFMASTPDSIFGSMMLDEMQKRFAKHPLLARLHADLETLTITGPLAFRDMLMDPESGPHATVLHWAQLRPIVVHESFKEWTVAQLKGNETTVDYTAWLCNSTDKIMFDATAHYTKKVRPWVFWPASFAIGFVSSASACVLAGLLVFVFALYIDYTQVSRVIHGGVQDHSVAFFLLVVGLAAGGVSRWVWNKLRKPSVPNARAVADRSEVV